MLWLPLALISAASIATMDALTKRFLSHLTVFEMAAARLSFSLPLFLILLLFIPAPHLDTTFYLTVFLALPLEITAFFLYMRAIQASPLSLAIPFLSFTPVFLILTGRLILGEELSARGIWGIISVVLGSYVLNLRECKNGFLGPFWAIKREKGSWLMLIVAFLYALTSAMGKKAIQHSSVIFFGPFYFLMLGLIVPGGLLVTGKATWQGLKKVFYPGLCIGILMVIMVLSHMAAISRVEAAYMIAVKRTGILFSVLYGAFLFKEENIGERFWGAGLMLAGVVIIAVWA